MNGHEQSVLSRVPFNMKGGSQGGSSGELRAEVKACQLYFLYPVAASR